MPGVEQALSDLTDYLTEEQQQRAGALAFARVVMNLGVPAPNVKPPEFPQELIDLAEYVCTGPAELEDDQDGDE